MLHAVWLFYSTHVLELIYYCETRRSLRLYVFAELSAVIWNDVSVVGVDSLTAHTMWIHCNKNDILAECNVVYHNRRNSK